MRKTISNIIVLTLLLVNIGFGQQNNQLLSTEIRDLLHESLSGELAKDHVIQITRHHRIQGSRGYRDAANYVLQQLKGFGYGEKDAFIESFKSDGKVKYQTWQSPSGWDIEWGELRMIEPYDERIVGYPEIAMSVITYSNPGDVTAELVWVGRGTSDANYDGKDVSGKIVLATGYGGSVHRLAVLKFGAKAVVCYLDDGRAKEYPDMLAYTGMWPKTGELDRVTFGFNLTNRQGEKLKNLLLSGKKVVVRGQVKGIGLESYFMDVPVAYIRGSELAEEELVFSAHLDHPKESANDNASGSAALLDIARTLHELIDSGRLPRPKRSFRFIWIPEWYGTMAYIDAHPEMTGPALGGKFLANMNMDMVGENLELLHSSLILTRTPASIPSIVNDVVANMAEMVDRMNIRTSRGSLSKFNYRVTSYSGGSDHMMFIERKIPGVMFSHSPDYTHHTSEDTPDKIDPVELERCELIATGTMWYLANLETDQGVDLAYLSGSNGAGRMGAMARKIHNQSLPEAKNGLNHALNWEIEAISSILQFNQSTKIKQVVNAIIEQFKQQHKILLKSISSSISTNGSVKENEDKRVPIRLTRGPLDFGLPESELSANQSAWYRSSEFKLNGTHRFELVNFINGKRTVSEIRNAMSAEFNLFQTKVIARYIDDLVKVGVLKWKE